MIKNQYIHLLQGEQVIRLLGIDLAWGAGTNSKPANETGVVAVDANGQIVDAGWTVGLAQTVAWMNKWAQADTLAMIDAPLVIANATGQRLCEKQVGQQYHPWNVSANSTNLSSRRQEGVNFMQQQSHLIRRTQSF